MGNRGLKDSTFRISVEKAKHVKEPVIRDLKIINGNDLLLKQLGIKDINDSRYTNKPTDTDYQIISGEVVINDIVFPLYIVIPKGFKIFSEQVRENSNIPIDDKNYNELTESRSLENYIKLSFKALSRVDKEVLKVIRELVEPIIVFKSSSRFDYIGEENWASYVCEPGEDGFTNARNVNLSVYSEPYIIHEFGHLFDHALGIVLESNNSDWRELGKKYSGALKKTTYCGNVLSGYKEEDYETRAREFFADLFYAYYMGDKKDKDTYLVEALDGEALEALEMEIGEAIQYSIEDEVNDEYSTITPNIEQIANYYLTIDTKLGTLIKKFLELCDSKILGVNDEYQLEDTNTFMYYYISPMMRLLINLHKQYLNNPSVENKRLIEEALSSFFEDIKSLSNMDIDDLSNNYLRLLITKDNIETDEDMYAINYAKANIRVYEILNILYSPNYKFSLEFGEEIIEDIKRLREEIKTKSSDGLSNEEYKIILKEIRNIISKLFNYNPRITQSKMF